MDDFPGNSRTTRAQETKYNNAPKAKTDSAESKARKPEKQAKIVQAGARVRKKTIGTRFKNMFISEDSKGTVNYVVTEVVGPRLRDMLSDVGSTALDRVLYGEGSSPRRSSGSRSSYGSYTAYNRYASNNPVGRDEPRRNISKRDRAAHNFDDILFNSRADAEEVLDTLNTLISQYEIATVGDLYSLTGIQGNHIDDKWGWTDLRGAGIHRHRGEFLLELPRPEQVER